MPTTPDGWPYPSTNDTPDVPRDIGALATAIDQRLPARMVTGQASVAMSNASTGSVAVTFPAGSFSAAPRVVVTVDSAAGAAGALIARVFSVTATGFTIGLTQAAGTPVTVTVPVEWIAVP